MSAAEDPSHVAFVAHYEELAPALHAWAALRIHGPLGRRIDPDDLVQEILARAYRGRATFDASRGEFRNWLFGIAHNVLKRWLLDLKRSPRTASTLATASGRDRLAEVPDDATSISRAVARDEAFSAFMERAGEFEEEDRKILMYRAIQGLTHPQIAERLGASVAFVEKRWQRLRDRVRDFGMRGLLLD